VVSKWPRRRPVTKDSLLHKQIEFPVRNELNEGVKVEPSIISGSCQDGGREGKTPFVNLRLTRNGRWGSATVSDGPMRSSPPLLKYSPAFGESQI
jgi:hypothetical protein